MSASFDFQLLRTVVELPTLLFLGILSGMVLRVRAKRSGTVVAIAAALLLYAVSTPFAGGLFIRTLEEEPAGQKPGNTPGTVLPPQAIVILSANARVTSADSVEPGPLTLERLRQGAKLHRTTKLPILVSGGPSKSIPGTLSSVMARSLADDFQLGAVWQEGKSGTTAENARFSSQFLAAKGIKSIYLVSHVWHIPRAEAEFRRAGLNVTPSPVELPRLTGKTRLRSFLPRASGLQASQFAAHEWLGRLWYHLSETQ